MKKNVNYYMNISLRQEHCVFIQSVWSGSNGFTKQHKNEIWTWKLHFIVRSWNLLKLKWIPKCLVPLEPEQIHDSEYVKIFICFYWKILSIYDVNTKFVKFYEIRFSGISGPTKTACKIEISNFLYLLVKVLATFDTKVVLWYFQ